MPRFENTRRESGSSAAEPLSLTPTDLFLPSKELPADGKIGPNPNNQVERHRPGAA